MIYFSLGGGIDQQISVFSFTFSPPWLLKQNSFFRNHAILFSIFYFLFLVQSSAQSPSTQSLVSDSPCSIYITTRFYGQNCKNFTIPLSRNCQKRLTNKEDQIKSGANPEIQKGPAGTLARNRDTFYFTENSCGGCVVLLASTLNPPMQRNSTREPRSHISNAGHLQRGEQRTTLNAVATAI